MAEEEVLEEQPKKEKKSGGGMLPIIILLAVVLVAVVATFVILQGKISSINGTVQAGVDNIANSLQMQQSSKGVFKSCEASAFVAPSDENLTVNTADGEHFMVVNFQVCFNKPFEEFLPKEVAASPEDAEVFIRPKIRQASYEFLQKIPYTYLFESKKPKQAKDESMTATTPAEEGFNFEGIEDEAASDDMFGAPLPLDSGLSDKVDALRAELAKYMNTRGGGLEYVSEVLFTNFIVE